MHKVQHKDAVYPFACTSCEYNAPTQDNLLEHLKKHSDEKPYACHICSYRAKNRTGINAHLKRKNHAAIRNVRISYKCRVCNLQLSNPSDLRSHIVTHIHTPEPIRFELICMCQYITKFEEIPIHINDHVKNSIQMEVDRLLIEFVCNIVNGSGDEQVDDNSVYNSSSGLQGNIGVPIITHHPNNVPLGYNNYRGNTQGSSQLSSSHSHWLQPSEIPNFPHQNLPPIHTINATNALQHTSNINNDVTPPHHYLPSANQPPLLHNQPALQSPNTSSVKVTVGLTCTVCNFEAYNDSELNYHVSTHSTVLYDQVSKMPFLYSCNICNFKGNDENELMLHMTTHVAFKYNNSSADIMEFRCDICSFNTYSQSNLDMHRLTHEDDSNNTESNMCGYKPTSSFDFRMHMTEGSDSEDMESPTFLTMNNSYDQQDYYSNNCQPFIESSGLLNYPEQEQYATLSNHI